MTEANLPSDHPEAPANAAQTADERVSPGHGDADDARLHRLARLIGASPHNLVARGERDHVFARHIAESRALAETLTPTGRWLDLGTGGGLPGLVLAVWYPDTRWTLLDATAKKIAEVARFAETLGLSNVVALQGRAEQRAHEPAHRGAYDGVVARAVAPLATLAELARGFVGDGGLIVAVKGPGWRQELDDAGAALQRLQLTVVSTVQLPGGVRESWVVTMRAHGTPPQSFPRRDGLPKHDPLH